MRMRARARLVKNAALLDMEVGARQPCPPRASVRQGRPEGEERKNARGVFGYGLGVELLGANEIANLEATVATERVVSHPATPCFPADIGCARNERSR